MQEAQFPLGILVKLQVVQMCRVGSTQAICKFRRNPKEFAQGDASVKFLKEIEDLMTRKMLLYHLFRWFHL